MYGSEAWSRTSKTESKLQAAEMKVLRLIRGVTMLDRMRNTKVREDLQVELLLDSIERSKLRWFGHVPRMEESRLPKRYLKWKPRGKRPFGRPRMRWLKSIEDAVERRGSSLELVANTELYTTRTEWKSSLNSCQLTESYYLPGGW